MAGRGVSMASVQTITAAERQRQALELRKGGVDYQTIANRLGYKWPSGAHKAVMSALKAVIREPAEDVLALELARLDALFFTLWPKARAGDTAAIDRVLRIMERRAKYLGLDAPIKIDLGAIVEEMATRHDLTPDEKAELHDDIQQFLLTQRAGAR